jgi:tetratricopeptide (TPR) repeat protein
MAKMKLSQSKGHGLPASNLKKRDHGKHKPEKNELSKLNSKRSGQQKKEKDRIPVKTKGKVKKGVLVDNSKPNRIRLFLHFTDNYVSIVVAVIFIILLSTSRLKTPSKSEVLREDLLLNPTSYDLNLDLADTLLNYRQYQEAEKILTLEGRNSSEVNRDNKVLGEQDPGNNLDRLTTLWQKKQMEDPQDIQKLITGWQKMVEQKPDYRDGFLQLGLLSEMLRQRKQALFYIDKALAIDPNYEPALYARSKLED